jgi:DNA-binding Lrp family transcriptional regulator
MDNKNNTNERFSIVPQNLISDDRFSANEFRALSYLIGTYQIKLPSGDPFTHSVTSISNGTGIPNKTANRIVKRLVELKLLKKYGWIQNLKSKYFIYAFDNDELERILSQPAELTIVKMTNDNPIDTKGDCEINDVQKEPTVVKMTDDMTIVVTNDMTTRKNIVKGTNIKEINIKGISKEEIDPANTVKRIVPPMSLINKQRLEVDIQRAERISIENKRPKEELANQINELISYYSNMVEPVVAPVTSVLTDFENDILGIQDNKSLAVNHLN